MGVFIFLAAIFAMGFFLSGFRLDGYSQPRRLKRVTKKRSITVSSSK